MDAPTPKIAIFTYIKKELTSEQGHKYSLEISYENNKFEFTVEEEGKLFKDKFRNEYTMNQIQENKYFKLFDNHQEILEELDEKIELKTPTLNASGNNTLNLIIYLQNSKFRQEVFSLTKVNFELLRNSEEFKSIVENLYNSVEELKKENKELKLQNEKLLKRLEEIENKQMKLI